MSCFTSLSITLFLSRRLPSMNRGGGPETPWICIRNLIWRGLHQYTSRNIRNLHAAKTHISELKSAAQVDIPKDKSKVGVPKAQSMNLITRRKTFNRSRRRCCRACPGYHLCKRSNVGVQQKITIAGGQCDETTDHLQRGTFTDAAMSTMKASLSNRFCSRILLE